MEERIPSVAALRDAFDAGFAAPAEVVRPPEVALLAVRVGAEPFALRLLETAGMLSARPIAPVPSRRAELLGVCALRGALVPVYSVARLLGRAEAPEGPRWLVLASAGGEDRLALAFAGFDGHLRVAAAVVAAAAPDTSGHVREVVELDGAARPVLSVPSLVGRIIGR
jgi:chemotaxis signal transduction protein